MPTEPKPEPEFHKREATLLSTRNVTRIDFLRVIDLLRYDSVKVRNDSVKASPFVTHRADFTNLAAEFPKWIQPDNDVIKAIVDV